MQKIREYVHFEGKKFNEVRNCFADFYLVDIKIVFFRTLFRDNKYIPEPGVFIDGGVNDNYSSQVIVKILRKQVNLEEKLIRCDISIDNENMFKGIKTGNWNYVGIRIKPPYQLETVYDLGSRIGEILNSSNILIRTVESENEVPLICIDLITSKRYEKL